MIDRSSAPVENASSTVYTPESRARASVPGEREHGGDLALRLAECGIGLLDGFLEAAGAAQEVDDHRVLDGRVVVQLVSVRLGLAQPLDGPQPAADGRLVRPSSSQTQAASIALRAANASSSNSSKIIDEQRNDLASSGRSGSASSCR